MSSIPTTFCENPLTFKDFQRLPEEERTILLDDDSLCLMFGIQENIRLLEPEGLDDVRTFRIETIGRRGKIIWYDVTIRAYQDYHWLILSSWHGESYSFANKDKWAEEDKMPKRHNCKTFLRRLWDYVNQIVHKIEDDPAAYVRYLETHAPYQEREGDVLRKDVQDLLPGIKIKVKNRRNVLNLLKKKQDETEEGGYDTMTLRTYIEAWKIAYCAYCQASSLEEESAEDVFRRSNCGVQLEEYGLDDPKEFARWDKDCNHYHCYDVVYVCIHLYPRYDSGTKKWLFDLAFSLETFGDAGFRIAFAFEKAGIPYTITGAKEKLAALLGEDTITFSPEHYGYTLPYPGEEGVKADNLQKAIETITWVPFKEIHGVLPHHGGKRERLTFYPCDDEHYPEPDQEASCLIRYPDHGRYHYWLWENCPWGWNVLERNHGEFCILNIMRPDY